MGQTITAERSQANVPLGVDVTRDGGITGLTVVMRIFNGANLTEFLDFDDGVFKAAGHAIPTQALAETGLGRYDVAGGFDLSAITLPAAADTLLVQYDITAGGELGNDTDTIQLVLNHKRIAFDNWEEILTGATHNVQTSAGRRLRQLGFDIEPGLAQAGGAATITLEAAESAIDGFFVERQIGIVDGLGVGQIRAIVAYVGATRIATVHRAWDVAPDLTSEYVIGSSAPTLPVLGLDGRNQVFEILTRQPLAPFKPLTGRLRQYDTLANALVDDGATGLLKTYNTVSTYDGNDDLIDHIMTEVGT